jgi:23S rRNA (uracil1939-C5)-methyltransferase
MAVVEQGSCKIEYLDAKTYGISTSPMARVQVLYTLPGEVVEFMRHEYRKESHCVLIKIIEPSVHRIQPACQYFTRCGGCSLQHLNENYYTSFKKELVFKALAEQNIETTINPVITIASGNRRRANLEAIKKDDQIFMGFHKANSHQIVNIDECPAMLKTLSDILLPLKKLLELILNVKQKAQIYITHASNGVDILIRSGDNFILPEEVAGFTSLFVKDHPIIKLTLKCRKKIDVLYAKEDPYVLFDDLKVHIDSECFLQPNSLSDNILPQLILNYLPKENNNLKVVDLFCGRGTYSLPLAKYFEVTSVDSNQSAISALNEAAIINKRNIKIILQDLFTSPILRDKLNEYAIAIINPPRAGAVAQVEQLSGSEVKHILYISCNPVTFAIDAKTLCNAGYNLIEVTPVDQFYWSAHIEIVGYFTKN